MHVNGEEKRIRIKFENLGKNEVKILIEDDGPGLEKEQKTRYLQEGLELMNKHLVVGLD